MRTYIYTILLIIVVSITGCAISVPRVAISPAVIPDTNNIKPVSLLYVDFKVYIGATYTDVVESKTERAFFEEVIKKTLVESGQFKNITFDQNQEYKATKKIQLDIYRLVDVSDIKTTVLIQMLGCGIIPSSYPESLSVRFKVFDTNNQVIYRENHTTDFRTKVGWIYIGNPDLYEGNVRKNTIHNQLLDLLNKSKSN